MAEKTIVLGVGKRSSLEPISDVPEKKEKTQLDNTSKTNPDNVNFKIKMSPIKMSLGSKKPNATIPIKMSLGGTRTNVAPIKMSLGPKKAMDGGNQVRKTNIKVASVFNEDDDSSEEEMPPEAKMKMRNIGRDTPTAAGPNSFGKGSAGFIDRRALLKKELDEQWNKTVEEEDKLVKTSKQ